MIARAMPVDDPATVAVPRTWRLSLALTPSEPTRLPALPGSELRGLLRQGLERLGRLRRGAPSPFTLTPQWLEPDAAPDRLVDWPAGRPMTIDGLWFGTDPDPAALVGAGFNAVGWQPLLGRGRRARFTSRVERARCDTGATIDQRVAELMPSLTLRLRAVTPLALRERGEMRTTLGDGMALLVSVRHRARRLADGFGAAPDEAIADRLDPLTVLADEMVSVRWRRVGRRGRTVPAQGLMGAARIARPAPETLRALVVGELLRVGRWTAFGAGRYTLEADPSA